MTLDDTLLPAVDGSGAPSGAPGLAVRAQFRVEDEGVDYDTYCGFDNGEVRGFFSDEAERMRLCVPTQDFEVDTGFYGLVLQGSDGPGQTYYKATSMEGRFSRGNFIGGIADTLRVNTEAGAVVSVLYTRRDGSLFRCDGAACSGVSITPPAGRRGARISLTNTTLVEQWRGGLGGDRSLQLNGNFSTPPPG